MVLVSGVALQFHSTHNDRIRICIGIVRQTTSLIARDGIIVKCRILLQFTGRNILLIQICSLVCHWTLEHLQWNHLEDLICIRSGGFAMNGMAYDDERSSALPLVRGILQPWTHNTGGYLFESNHMPFTLLNVAKIECRRSWKFQNMKY
jgi:hypothetical protein